MGCIWLAVALAGLLGCAAADSKKVTILSTTDVHGYVYGHIDQPDTYIDYGDYRRFADCMINNNQDRTFLLLDSGDLIQGTGLSDYTEPPGTLIYEVFKRFGYDAITIGNHDAGEPTSMDWIVDQGYGEMFVSGNVFYNKDGFESEDCSYDTSSLLGKPYKIIEKNGMITLVLGFLYGATTEDSVCNLRLEGDSEKGEKGFFDSTYWQNAQDDIQAIINKGGSLDLIVTLNHISSQDNQQKAIYTKVREVYPNTPLAMLNGHSHRSESGMCKDSSYLQEEAANDDNCFYIESDCYMYKVGIIDFEIEDGAFKSQPTISLPKATYEDLDTRCEGFMSTNSEKADELDNFIWSNIDEMELLQVAGYSNWLYDSDLKPSISNALWRLYYSAALPTELYAKIRENGADADMPSGEWVVFVNSGSMRADIKPGEVLKDSIPNILPFKNTFRYMKPALTGEQLLKVYNDINYNHDDQSDKADYFVLPILPNEIVNDKLYVIISSSYDYTRVDEGIGYTLGWNFGQTWSDIKNVPNMMEVIENYIYDYWDQSLLSDISIKIHGSNSNLDFKTSENAGTLENENTVYLTLVIIFCIATIIAQIVARKKARSN